MLGESDTAHNDLYEQIAKNIYLNVNVFNFIPFKITNFSTGSVSLLKYYGAKPFWALVVVALHPPLQRLHLGSHVFEKRCFFDTNSLPASAISHNSFIIVRCIWGTLLPTLVKMRFSQKIYGYGWQLSHRMLLYGGRIVRSILL